MSNGTVVITWDEKRNVAQAWLKDEQGWFPHNWGLTIRSLAKVYQDRGYRVILGK